MSSAVPSSTSMVVSLPGVRSRARRSKAICAGLEALVDQVAARAAFQRRDAGGKILAERLQPAGLADRLHVGEADAIGRQHAGQRMDEDPLHAQRIGDPAGMLAAGAAEAGERVAGDVMAAGDRDLADRGGHIVDRDVEEALGDLLEALGAAQRVGDLLQPRARDASGSSGWSAVGPNTAGNFAGSIRPRNRLQSVTVSGPPAR